MIAVLGIIFMPIPFLARAPLLWLIVAPLPGLGALALFLRLHFRRDLVPDYLSQHCGRFFESNGLCFCLSLLREDGIAVFRVMFQGRYTGKALAQIAIRPQGTRQTTATPEIECGPASFGIVSIPTAVPARYQGQGITFEVGATVRYPEGKGKMVRFRAGVPVLHNARFGGFSIVIWRVLHLMAGHLLLSGVRVTMSMPTLVAEQLAEDIVPSIETVWTLDPDMLLC
ncbi:MAG: hypothetical protein ABR915_09795 [Thermoguttaceae bacterium]